MDEHPLIKEFQNKQTDMPLLTICIPTYNRGPRVQALCYYLLENILSRYPNELELLVVNNCSSDNTETLLEPLQSLGLRLINRREHLPSAEANMFASVDLCTGKYIWFLGDDDIPLLEAINWLVVDILSDQIDMYIFSSTPIDNNGLITAERSLRLNSRYIDLSSGDEIVFSCGFLYVLAGISSVVFRRSKANGQWSDEIHQIQEIYSHVAWLIRCFSNSCIRVVSTSLVYYRIDDPVKQFTHFQKYAKLKGIGDRYVWGLGMIKLMRYLLDSNSLSAEGINRIYDGRRDGTRFRFIDELVHQIYLQLKDSILSNDKRNRVMQEDFSSAMDFLHKIDLFIYDRSIVLEELMKLSEQKWDGTSVIEESEGLFQKHEKIFFAQLEQSFYRPITFGRVLNYHLYRVPIGFVAISDEYLYRRNEILMYLDPVDELPHVLTSTTEDSLVVKINEMIKEYAERKKSYELEESIHKLSKNVHDLALTHREISNTVRNNSELVWQLLHPIKLFASKTLNRFRRIKKWFNLH